ncbi:MAG: plasmid pRiA4b ORF-3 family protein [Treponema sp.]|jgi:hypothetical protein|nr:plasmid pRiA4b ORF-3 family protein [Treponema sp.]
MAKRKPTREARFIYVFRIGIEGSNPRIWRKLRVPGNFTLADLHEAIQIAFDWTDSHLHSFTVGSTEYMMEPEVGMEVYDEEDALCEDDYCLDDLNLREKGSFSYLYDFGDSWEHKITVNKVLPYTDEEAQPLCLDGKNAGPLEDSGGVWGYAEMLEILKNPRHEEYEETLEWAGDVDPLAFVPDKVNQTLKRVFAPVPAQRPGGRKPGKKSESPPKAKVKDTKPAVPRSGKKNGPPDGKLKKLYALMNRFKELKPWEKLWDTNILLIEAPGREPVICSVLGRGGQGYGIVVYPGFSSILTFLRMAESGDDNPCVSLGYHNWLSCRLGGRDEVFADEKERLKELGITFRGKYDWVFFRKAMPGLMPWYINSKDADILIETLARFFDVYALFEAGSVTVNFDNDEILIYRYAEKDKTWIAAAGEMPAIPMTVSELQVEASQVEPLRFKKQTKLNIEADTLYFPGPVDINDEGVPILMRVNILMDHDRGLVLDQALLKPEEDGPHELLNLLFNFINNHGRPKTVMVRDKFAEVELGDFCRKIGISLVHSQGMSAADNFTREWMSYSERV